MHFDNWFFQSSKTTAEKYLNIKIEDPLEDKMRRTTPDISRLYTPTIPPKTALERLEDMLKGLTYTDMERFSAFLTAHLKIGVNPGETAKALLSASKSAAEDAL